MPKKTSESDYGLPVLTFDEAARVLGVEVGAFKAWAIERLDPKSTGRWGEWSRGDRPLPERLIRLWLVDHPVKAWDAEEFRKMAEQWRDAGGDRPKSQTPTPARERRKAAG